MVLVLTLIAWNCSPSSLPSESGGVEIARIQVTYLNPNSSCVCGAAKVCVDTTEDESRVFDDLLWRTCFDTQCVLSVLKQLDSVVNAWRRCPLTDAKE